MLGGELGEDTRSSAVMPLRFEVAAAIGSTSVFECEPWRQHFG